MSCYVKTQPHRSGIAWCPLLAPKPRQACVCLAVQLDGLKSQAGWFLKASVRAKHARHRKWRGMARGTATAKLAEQQEACSCRAHAHIPVWCPPSYPLSERGGAPFRGPLALAIGCGRPPMR